LEGTSSSPRAELTQIVKLFGQDTIILLDAEASEQSLEELRKKGDLSKYRYLHFATHGEANNVRAMESTLVLAQDTLPKDPLHRAGEPFINGQLSAKEVLEFWKLDAELVTFSACETALGRDGGGDGLLGFAQAFLAAGSRAVCLSLWKVDDTATALLMIRFYQNLLGKREGLDRPMPKAAALAEAKRWLRDLSMDEALKLTAAASNGVGGGDRGKDQLVTIVPDSDSSESVARDSKPFAHPRYWSAFILIGDPN
jgi:CHAT domain-containing protein